jgi:methylglutaconyl-CoA hydratase
MTHGKNDKNKNGAETDEVSGSSGFETIAVEDSGSVVRVSLNRPEVHNAFNSTMIGELARSFDQLKGRRDVRVIVLTGRGKSFCAGADLNWMREIISYSFEQNLEESLQIAELMESIHSCPKPTIALVNGAAIGGGVGFLSACDVAVAADRAQFGLSEVKIGLVPAAISPYVVGKIGQSHAREYFLTGERISAARAAEIGLVNRVVPLEVLEDEAEKLVNQLLTSGPDALASCKTLLNTIPRLGGEEVKRFTARMIAELRVSDEGQEGMASFLEKRKPKWAE